MGGLMKTKFSVYLVYILYMVHYSTLTVILYLLRALIMSSVLNMVICSTLLSLYLFVSVQILKKYRNNLRKNSKNEIRSLVDSYREDGQKSAKELENIRRLIINGEHEAAIRLIDSVSGESNQHLTNQQGSFLECFVESYKTKIVDRGISFHIDFQQEYISEYLTNKQITSILGNLLDNAYEALEHVTNQNEKWIRLKVVESTIQNEKQLIVHVENGGQTLKTCEQEVILKAGVTKKKGSNHGYGLAVVSDIVSDLGGTIDLVAEPETKMAIIIPSQIS